MYDDVFNQSRKEVQLKVTPLLPLPRLYRNLWCDPWQHGSTGCMASDRCKGIDKIGRLPTLGLHDSAPKVAGSIPAVVDFSLFNPKS